MYWKTVKYRNINEMTRYIPSDFVQSKWESFSSALFYHYLARNQGCALSEPGGLWRLTFALGRLENHMLGTLDFTASEHWAPFNFP